MKYTTGGWGLRQGTRERKQKQRHDDGEEEKVRDAAVRAAEGQVMASEQMNLK